MVTLRDRYDSFGPPARERGRKANKLESLPGTTRTFTHILIEIDACVCVYECVVPRTIRATRRFSRRSLCRVARCVRRYIGVTWA